ncbi:MAG: imidazolonepropionase [Holophagales bacterium]|nr:imidazolonepropionase [Holophagales bacterium]
MSSRSPDHRPVPDPEEAARPFVIRSCRLATFAGDVPYGSIEDGALAVRRGRLAWVGRASTLPEEMASWTVLDARGFLITPGLIDCHTHLVWGGDRIVEFEMRLRGVPYADIARRGGGIHSSVRATRESSEEELLRGARSRLSGLMGEGVTTVEIKSGYGLDARTELRMLRVARRLGAELPVRVRATFLGAHAVPPEAPSAGEYLESVISDMLPAAMEEGLVDAVDAFCEGIAFSPEEVDRLFTAARGMGLPVKLHAEQLSLLGGAAVAARHGALSADHLEYLDAAGVEAMAGAGTVAVLLPGAFYFLRERQLPPVELLRRHGVPIAVATDLNPGSSPVHSLLTALNFGCLLFHLTPEEALAGATREAARALGLAAELGTLETGKRADLAFWDVDHPAALVANLGARPCVGRIFDGAVLDSAGPYGGMLDGAVLEQIGLGSSAPKPAGGGS